MLTQLDQWIGGCDISMLTNLTTGIMEKNQPISPKINMLYLSGVLWFRNSAMQHFLLTQLLVTLLPSCYQHTPPVTN